jgi:predicted DNA-binding transcriptional regulator AlpA
MVIQLLVNVEAPDIRPGLNAELHQDLKKLAVDCLECGLKRHSEFPIKSEVIDLPSGTALTAASELLMQIIANKPLLTKADVCIRMDVTARTLERHVADGSFPQPIHVHGPRWRAEDIAAYETEKNGPPQPHRD